MSQSLVLFSNYVNSAGERVRIALGLKGLEYEYVSALQLGIDKYRALNPQGLMPALKLGETIVPQSTAILEYLEETWPAPPLLPADPVLRATVRGFAQHVTSEMHAIDVIRVRRFLHNALAVDEAGIKRWQRHWFVTGFTALETMLEMRETEWLCCYGDSPGWADLHLVPQVRKGLTRFALDMSPYPNLLRAYEAAIAHPAFIAAEPRNQPDYPGSFREPSLSGRWGETALAEPES